MAKARFSTQPLIRHMLALAVSASIGKAAMTNAETTFSDAEVAALARRIDRPIVLVGMMGVGKSTIGRRLAATLKLPFADADEEIEKAAQMAINEIFERFGEDYFRDGERRVIARLIDEQPSVIATGGGAFCQDETRALLLERAITVWIDCDVATLVARTRAHCFTAAIRMISLRGSSRSANPFIPRRRYIL
jgi:shikimate kinase